MTISRSRHTFKIKSRSYIQKGWTPLVYIDDIIIFSKSFEEHLNDIEGVFKRLLNGGLKVKMKKCQWAKSEVTFLGHRVSNNGVKPDPANLEKVLHCTAPRNVKELQQFLGLAGYYRRFVEGYAKLAQPLNDLLKRDRKYLWKEDQEKSFQILKVKLISTPILKFPDFNKNFTLMTDASDYAIGAVLGQLEEGNKEVVIAYASRGLKAHEKNYAVIEKEALAIIFAVKYFRHYIWGRRIQVLTDQRPLQWLMTHKDTSSRLIRWALYLQEYDLEIKYRKGSANANADFLSRLKEPLVATILQVKPISEEISKEQEKDTDLKWIFKSVIEKKVHDECPMMIRNHLNKELERYIIQNGILRFRAEELITLVVPESLKNAIMLQYHDGALGGHLSSKKTVSRIKMKYFWLTMKKDIKKWCQDCRICISRRGGARPRIAPLQPISIPPAPMELTAMDIIGPLPLSAKGNKFILVFMDYFTK